MEFLFINNQKKLLIGYEVTVTIKRNPVWKFMKRTRSIHMCFAVFDRSVQILYLQGSRNKQTESA